MQWKLFSSDSDQTSTISNPNTDETRAIELATALIAAVLKYLPAGLDDNLLEEGWDIEISNATRNKLLCG